MQTSYLCHVRLGLTSIQRLNNICCREAFSALLLARIQAIVLNRYYRRQWATWINSSPDVGRSQQINLADNTLFILLINNINKNSLTFFGGGSTNKFLADSVLAGTFLQGSSLLHNSATYESPQSVWTGIWIQHGSSLWLCEGVLNVLPLSHFPVFLC